MYKWPRRIMIHQNQFLNANLHGYRGQHQHMHCSEYASFILTIMYKFQTLHSIKYDMDGQMVNNELRYKDYISQTHLIYFSCQVYIGNMFQPRLGHHQALI